MGYLRRWTLLLLVTLVAAFGTDNGVSLANYSTSYSRSWSRSMAPHNRRTAQVILQPHRSSSVTTSQRRPSPPRKIVGSISVEVFDVPRRPSSAHREAVSMAADHPQVPNGHRYYVLPLAKKKPTTTTLKSHAPWTDEMSRGRSPTPRDNAVIPSIYHHGPPPQRAGRRNGLYSSTRLESASLTAPMVDDYTNAGTNSFLPNQHRRRRPEQRRRHRFKQNRSNSNYSGRITSYHDNNGNANLESNIAKAVVQLQRPVVTKYIPVPDLPGGKGSWPNGINSIESSCFRCPSDETIVLNKGESYAVVPFPRVHTCRGSVSSISPTGKVFLSVGPEPGTPVQEGEYLMQLYIVKPGVQKRTCQYKICVQGKKCSAIQNPPHGVMWCTKGNFWGSVCSFACRKRGCKLRGDPVITCEGDHRGVAWSAPPARCDCSPRRLTTKDPKRQRPTSSLRPITTASPSTTRTASPTRSPIVEMTTAKATTDVGTTVSPSPSTVKPKPPPSVCFPCCKQPRNPQNGLVYCEPEFSPRRFSPGATCRFYCQVGYEVPIDVATSGPTLICMGNGKWNKTQEVECLPVQCPRLKAPKNGSLRCVDPLQGPHGDRGDIPSTDRANYMKGNICAYECDPGFAIPTSQLAHATVVCRAPSWNSTVQPKCEEVIPPVPLGDSCKDQEVTAEGRVANISRPVFVSKLTSSRLESTCTLRKMMPVGEYQNNCTVTDPELRVSASCSYKVVIKASGCEEPASNTAAVAGHFVCNSSRIGYYPPSTFCTYECPENYVVPSSQLAHAVRRCLPDLRWNSTVFPECKEKIPPKNDAALCSDQVLKASRGYAVPKIPRFKSASGLPLKTSCSVTGKLQVGTYENYCTATDPELRVSTNCSFKITVKVLDCVPPPKIKNGFLECVPPPKQGSYLPGMRCTYQCDDGYVIPSRQLKFSVRECLQNLRWNQTTKPECKPAAPPSPVASCSHQVLHTIYGYAEVVPPRFKTIKGTELVAKCTLMEKIPPGTYTNKCKATDPELRTTGVCVFNVTVKVHECSPPPSIKHGNILCNFVVDGIHRPKTVCEYVCHENYKIPTDQEDRVHWECLEDLRWNVSSPPSCILRECQPPPAIRDGNVICNSEQEGTYPPSTVCQYSCKEGYGMHSLSSPKNVQADATWMCLTDLKWNASSVPHCKINECPLPPDIGNGHFTCHSPVPGVISPSSVCQYTCNEGYSIPASQVGNAIWICLEDRRWNVTTVPECRLKECESPPTTVNGRVSCMQPPQWDNMGYPIGTVCEYLCQPGYVIPTSHMESNGWECLENQRWNQTDAPECKAKSAPVPKEGSCIDKTYLTLEPASINIKLPAFVTANGNLAEVNCNVSKVTTFGAHKIACEAKDFELRTTSSCTFEIQVNPEACQAQPAISNGHVSCTFLPGRDLNYPVGTECTYECRDGFVIPTSQLNRRTWKCLPTLVWNATDTPECEQVTAPIPKEGSCIDRTYLTLEPASIDIKLPAFVTANGALAEVNCNVSKVTTFGVHKIACEAKDTELRTTSSCTFEIQVNLEACQAQPAISNGHVSCTFLPGRDLNYPVGTECTYECRDGFVIPTSQLNRRTWKCLPTLVWNATDTPECEQATVPIPKEGSCIDKTYLTLEPASIDIKLPAFVTANGALAEVNCNASKVTTFGVHKIACEAKDTELRTTSSCTFEIQVNPEACQAQPAIANGHVSCTFLPGRDLNYSVGTECTYECRDGFVIPTSQLNRKTWRCLPTLVWNATDTPECEQATVPIPEDGSCMNESYATSNPSSIMIGKPTFLTEKGELLDDVSCTTTEVSEYGVHENTCTVKDPELRTTASCTFYIHVQKECDAPPSIANGNISCTLSPEDISYPVDAECSYVCNPGFVIPTSQQDRKVWKCLPDPKWDMTDPPECKAEIAPVPEGDACKNPQIYKTTSEPSSVQIRLPMFITASGAHIQAACNVTEVTDFGSYENTCAALDPELLTLGNCSFSIHIQKDFSTDYSADDDDIAAPEKCPPIPWPVPDVAKISCNASHEEYSHSFFTICRFECHAGYVIPTSQLSRSVLQCLPHQIGWNVTGEPPECWKRIIPEPAPGSCSAKEYITSDPSSLKIQIPEFHTSSGTSANVTCDFSSVSDFGTYINECTATDPELRTTASCKIKIDVKPFPDHEDCPRLRAPYNGQISCKFDDEKELAQCNVSCQEGSNFSLSYPSLLSQGYVECKFEDGIWDFQEKYPDLKELPDCLYELPTTFLEAPIRFSVGVQDCKDTKNLDYVVTLSKDLLQAENEESCSVAECEDFTHVCDEATPQKPSLNVTWMVRGSYEPDEYINEIPVAETVIEDIQIKTAHVMTGDPLFRESLAEVGAELWPDSFRIEHFKLICNKRGYIVDPDTNKCTQCPTGTYEEQGECRYCPGNHYQDQPGQTNCKTCPEGTTSISGSRFSSDCTAQTNTAALLMPDPVRDDPRGHQHARQLGTPCDPNPCLNDGVCIVTAAGFLCECNAGFEGTKCQNRTCPKNYCHNGGSCMAGPRGKLMCICPQGFGGRRCQSVLAY